MRGVQRLSLLFTFFLLITISYTDRAWAVGQIVSDPALTAAVTTGNAANLSAICTALTGNPSCVYSLPAQRLVPGEVIGADQIPMPVTPTPGLAGYFEQYWWPRQIELTKAQQGADAKVQTLLSEKADRTQQAGKYSDYKQRVDYTTVRDQMRGIATVDVLCPPASMGSAQLAMHIMALQVMRQLDQQASDEMSGSSDFPATAMGRVEYAKARVQNQVTNQLCLSKGDNGAGDGYCAATKDDIRNADVQQSTLTTSWVLETEAQKPYSTALVKNFLDNLFANKVFEPLPKRLTDQKPLPNDVAEILGDRLSYMAAMSTLLRPYQAEVADRTPLAQKPQSFEALEAAVTRAGYDGEIKKVLVNTDKISKASAEYIINRVYEEDPQSIATDLAALAGGPNEGNYLAMAILKEKKQIVLLYDIREQLKQTNMMLGTIGALLAAPQYHDIRARTEAVSAGVESAGTPQ